MLCQKFKGLKCSLIIPAEKEVTPDFFREWFIGFSEGGGGFYCDRNAKRFYFKIRQLDPKILYKIKSYFRFGSVSQDADGYFTYTVSKKKDILKLIHIFNGNLVLQKTNKRFVSEWVDNFNYWFQTNISYKGVNPFPGFTSAWLCGFTDADGSFGFKFSRDLTRKHKGRVRCYWYLSQSYAEVDLNKFKRGLKIGYVETLKNNAFRFTVTNLNECLLVSRYFDTFPPQTINKQVRFARFKRVLNWCLDGNWVSHLEEILHLISLNKKLNKR